MSEPQTSYVVYYEERLRDETVRGARIYSSLEAAVASINYMLKSDGPNDNTEYYLFELGKQIPIEIKEENEVTEVVKSVRSVVLTRE